MPIRLNLYAEDQALEAMRRRDPTKRAILVGLVVVAAMLIWSSTLMFKTVVAKNELNAVNRGIGAQTNAYAQIVFSERKLNESREKLSAIHTLATNRFLNGTLLNALQRAVVENVQVKRLKINQTYAYTPEFKPKDDSDKRPPKPATVMEKITILLDATDTSPNGEAATRFQNALSGMPYFERILAKTNGFRLTSVGAPQTTPAGQTFTTFTLEANLPEKTR